MANLLEALVLVRGRDSLAHVAHVLNFWEHNNHIQHQRQKYESKKIRCLAFLNSRRPTEVDMTKDNIAHI